jgi:hypothetical protein
MEDYYGYTVKQNPQTSRWEIFWKGKKQELDFACEADAKQWIDDQIPLNR